MELKDTRSGFGDALVEVGRENSQVVGLCADLTSSLKMDKFSKEFPNRFFQVGVAEANMIGISAGLAIEGNIPFVGSFANFITGRVYDQIRQSIAYSNNNVKICASHAGITLGEDGATHQILEDIGLMKMLPNMVVINTCDYNQTYLATKAILKYVGPVYLRFGRPKVPNFSGDKFEIGKGIVLKEEKNADVTIISTGHMVWRSLQAYEKLKNRFKVNIINIHTIKPLDKEMILKYTNESECVVVAEEHLKNGGLGDSVAQLLSEEFPVPIGFVSIDDKFGQSGKPDKLMEKYGLSVDNIISESERVIIKKYLRWS